MEEVEYLEEYVEEYPNAIPQILNNTEIEEFLPVNEDDRFDLLPVNTSFDEFIEEDPLVSRYRNDFQRNLNVKKVNEMTTYNAQKEIVDGFAHKESNKGSSKYNYTHNSINSKRSDIVAKVISCKTIDTSAIRDRSFPFSTAPKTTSIHATRKPNLIQATKTTKYSKQSVSRNLFGSYTKLNLNKSIDSSLNKIVAIKKSNSNFVGNLKLPTLRGSVNIFGNFNEKIIKYKKENPELFPIKKTETYKSIPKITARQVSKSFFTNKNNPSYSFKEGNGPMFKPNLNVKKFSRYANKSMSPLTRSNESLEKELLAVEDEIDDSQVAGEEIVKTNESNEVDDSDKDSFDGLVETLNEYIEDESNNEEQESPYKDKCDSSPTVSQTIKLDIQPNIINEGMHYLHINETTNAKASTSQKSQERSKAPSYQEKHDEENKAKKYSHLDDKLEKKSTALKKKQKGEKVESSYEVDACTSSSNKNEKCLTSKKKNDILKAQTLEHLEEDVNENSVVKSDEIKSTKSSISNHDEKSSSAEKSANTPKQKTNLEKIKQNVTKTESDNKKEEKNKINDNCDLAGIQKNQLSENSLPKEEKNNKTVKDDIVKSSSAKSPVHLDFEKPNQSEENAFNNNTDSNKEVLTNDCASDKSKQFPDNAISTEAIIESEVIPFVDENVKKNETCQNSDLIISVKPVTNIESSIASEHDINTKNEKNDGENNNIEINIETSPEEKYSKSSDIAECDSDQNSKPNNEKLNSPTQSLLLFNDKNDENPINDDQKNNLDEVDEIDNILAEIDSVMESIHSDKDKPMEMPKTPRKKSVENIKKSDDGIDTLSCSPEKKEEDRAVKVFAQSELTKQTEISLSTKEVSKIKKADLKPKEIVKDLNIKNDLQSETEKGNIESVDNTEDLKSITSHKKSPKNNKSLEELSKNDSTKTNWKGIIKPAKVVLCKSDKIFFIKKNSTENTDSDAKLNSLEFKEKINVEHTTSRSRKHSKERTSIEKGKRVSTNENCEKRKNSRSGFLDELESIFYNESNISEVDKSKSCEKTDVINQSVLNNEDKKKEKSVLSDNSDDNTKNHTKTLIRTRSNKKIDATKQENLSKDKDPQVMSKKTDENVVKLEGREKKIDVQTDKEVEHIMSIPSSVNIKETRFGRKRILFSSNSESGNSDKIFESDNSTIGSPPLEANSKRRKINRNIKLDSKPKYDNKKKDSEAAKTDIELYFQNKLSYFAQTSRSSNKKNTDSKSTRKSKCADINENQAIEVCDVKGNLYGISEKLIRGRKSVEKKVQDIQSEGKQHENLQNNISSIETNKGNQKIASGKKTSDFKIKSSELENISTGEKKANRKEHSEREHSNIKNTEETISSKNNSSQVILNEDKNSKNNKNTEKSQQLTKQNSADTNVTNNEANVNQIKKLSVDVSNLEKLEKSDEHKKTGENISSIKESVSEIDNIKNENFGNIESPEKICGKLINGGSVDKTFGALEHKRKSSSELKKLQKSATASENQKQQEKDIKISTEINKNKSEQSDDKTKNNLDKHNIEDIKTIDKNQKAENLRDVMKTTSGKSGRTKISSFQTKNEKDKDSINAKNRSTHGNENVVSENEKEVEFDKTLDDELNESRSLRIKIRSKRTSGCPEKDICGVVNKKGDILKTTKSEETKLNDSVHKAGASETLHCEKMLDNEFDSSSHKKNLKVKDESVEKHKLSKKKEEIAVNKKELDNKIALSNEENRDDSIGLEKTIKDKYCPENTVSSENIGIPKIAEEDKNLHNTRNSREVKPCLTEQDDRKSANNQKEVLNVTSKDKNVDSCGDITPFISPLNNQDKNSKINSTEKGTSRRAKSVDEKLIPSIELTDKKLGSKYETESKTRRNSENSHFTQNIINKLIIEEDKGLKTTLHSRSTNDCSIKKTRQISSDEELNKSKTLEKEKKSHEVSESTSNIKLYNNETINEQDKNLKGTTNKKDSPENIMSDIGVDKKVLQNQKELENQKTSNNESNNLKRLSKINRKSFETIGMGSQRPDDKIVINTQSEKESSKEKEIVPPSSHDVKESNRIKTSSTDTSDKLIRLEKRKSSQNSDLGKSCVPQDVNEEDKNLKIYTNDNESNKSFLPEINEDQKNEEEELSNVKQLEQLDSSNKPDNHKEVFADPDVTTTEETDQFKKSIHEKFDEILENEVKNKINTPNNEEVVKNITEISIIESTKPKKKRSKMRKSAFFSKKKKSRKTGEKKNTENENAEVKSHQNIANSISIATDKSVPENKTLKDTEPLQSPSDENIKTTKESSSNIFKKPSVQDYTVNKKKPNYETEKKTSDPIFVQPKAPSNSDNSQTLTRKRTRTSKEYDVKMLASALNESMLIPKSEKRREGSRSISTTKSVQNNAKTAKEIKPIIRSARIIRRRQSNLIQITRKEYEKVVRENLRKRDREKQLNNKNLLKKFGIVKLLKVKVKRLSKTKIQKLKQLQSSEKEKVTEPTEAAELKKSAYEQKDSAQKISGNEIVDKVKSFLEQVYTLGTSLKEIQKSKSKDNLTESENSFDSNSQSMTKEVDDKSKSKENQILNNEKPKKRLVTTLPLNDRVSKRNTKRENNSKRMTRARSMPRSINNSEDEETNSSRASSNSRTLSSFSDKNETLEALEKFRNLKSKSRTPTPSHDNQNIVDIPNNTEKVARKTSITKSLNQTVQSIETVEQKKIDDVNVVSKANDINLKNSTSKNSKRENKKITEPSSQSSVSTDLLEDSWISTTENILIENEIELQQENSLKKILPSSSAKADSTFVSTIVPLNQLKPSKAVSISQDSLNNTNQIKKVIQPTTKSSLQKNGQVRWLPAHIVVETVFMTRDEYDRKNLRKIITPTPPSTLTTQLKTKELSKITPNIVETPALGTSMVTKSRTSLINVNNNRDVDSILLKISDLLENQVKNESQINVSEPEEFRRRIQRLNNVNKMRLSSENALQVLIFLQNYFFNVTPAQDTFLKPLPIQQKTLAPTFNLVSTSTESPLIATTISSNQQKLTNSEPDTDKCFSFKKILLQKQPNSESNNSLTDQKIEQTPKHKSTKRIATTSQAPPVNMGPPPKIPRTLEKQIQLTNTTSSTLQSDLITSIRKEPEEILPDLENILMDQIKEETPDEIT
ncbi:protein PF3D7_1417600-like [Condylostylus longicornis]|uniref:protein PF3D7_1417600-like n=1 Tax=Condylostylus longicornis TaxID=2530218 RepID=UPI00244E51B1|nr:protein PF3D7_1417600-like [Condylostylus longicornis]